VNDRETAALLSGIDGARSARPKFEAELRAELLGDQKEVAPLVTLVDTESPARQRPRPRRRWLLAAASLAAVLAVVGSALRFGSDDRNVQSGSAGEATAVQTACATFRSEAFRERSRDDLVGHSLRLQRDDVTSARLGFVQLRRALDTLGSDLADAGLLDPELAALLETARGEAGSVIVQLDSGDSDRASSVAQVLGDTLVTIERRLTAVGVPNCL
jgi:hypothetical protein